MVQQIQALEWQKGFTGLTSGTYDNVLVIHCVADGIVTAHFPNGDEARTFTSGEDMTLNSVSITISSGTFDLNVR